MAETRGSNSNYATVFTVTTTTTINELCMWSAVDDAQSVKFIIFDSLFNGGSGAVLFSQTKAFPAQAAGYICTDPLSFTFNAGSTYDVGILGNGVSLTGEWAIPASPYTVGPFDFISR